MKKINKLNRVLLGAMLAALMFPLVGCVIRDRDHYYRDHYRYDYDEHHYYHRR